MRSETEPGAASRRKFLTNAAATAGAATMVGAPFIRTAAAATTTWKVQTSWPAGVGLDTFKQWCSGIKEKTGGGRGVKPYPGEGIAGAFALLAGVHKAVSEARKPFAP